MQSVDESKMPLQTSQKLIGKKKIFSEMFKVNPNK